MNPLVGNAPTSIVPSIWVAVNICDQAVSFPITQDSVVLVKLNKYARRNVPHCTNALTVAPNMLKVKNSYQGTTHASNARAMKISEIIKYQSRIAANFPAITKPFTSKNFQTNARPFITVKLNVAQSIGSVVSDFFLFIQLKSLLYFNGFQKLFVDFAAKDLSNPKIVPWHSTSSLAGCKFGSLDVKHLEGIETNNKCRKCTCKIPPYLTCTQEPDCV